MFKNVVHAKRDYLEAQFAFTFADDEEQELDRQGFLWDEYCGWTGWQRRMWPANILRADMPAYVFNKQCRALVGLYKIVHCGVFQFSSMEQFARQVKRGCGEVPVTLGSPTSRRLGSDIGDPDVALDFAPPQDRPASFKKWAVVEQRVAGNGSKPCTGIAFCARLIRAVDPCFTLIGRFQQIGWCDLWKPGFGMS